MNRNCNFEKLVSFKPCRLLFVGPGTDVPKPPEQGVEGAAAEAPKTPEEKRQQLADGIQKIEQKVAALTKQIDERSGDSTFQGVLSARKLDVGAALKDIAAKVAAIKANLDKPDTDKHAATLDEIQKVLAPLEDAVDSADFPKELDKVEKQAEREGQAKLKKINDEMKVRFPKDEAERAKAFKEAKAEKGNETAEVGKEFKLKESTNLFDNIGKKEGRIVGVLDGNTMVKIIDKKMMSVTTRGDIADATGFDQGSVHPWVKVEGKFKTGVDGKGPEKTYKGWIPWELISPEAGKAEAPQPAQPDAKKTEAPQPAQPDAKKTEAPQPAQPDAGKTEPKAEPKAEQPKPAEVAKTEAEVKTAMINELAGKKIGDYQLGNSDGPSDSPHVKIFDKDGNYVGNIKPEKSGDKFVYKITFTVGSRPSFVKTEIPIDPKENPKGVEDTFKKAPETIAKLNRDSLEAGQNALRRAAESADHLSKQADELARLNKDSQVQGPSDNVNNFRNEVGNKIKEYRGDAEAAKSIKDPVAAADFIDRHTSGLKRSPEDVARQTFNTLAIIHEVSVTPGTDKSKSPEPAPTQAEPKKATDQQLAQPADQPPQQAEIVKPKMYTNPDRPLITNLPEDGKWYPGSEVADSSDPNLKTHPEIQYKAENGELHARYSGDKYGQKGIDTTTAKWNKDGKKWEVEKAEVDETKVNWQEAYVFIIDDIIKEADGKNIKPENFGDFVQTYLHQDFSGFYKTPIEKSGKTEDQFIKDAGAKFEANEAAKPKFATVEGRTIKLSTPAVDIDLTEGTSVQINEKDGEDGRFQRIITNMGDIVVIDSNTKETFIYNTDGKPPKWERIPAGDYKPDEEQQKAIQSATERSRQVLEPKDKSPAASPDAPSEVGAISDEVLKKMDPITQESLGMQWIGEFQVPSFKNIMGEEFLKHVYVVKGAQVPSDVLDAKARDPKSPGYTMRELLMKRQQELNKKENT